MHTLVSVCVCGCGCEVGGVLLVALPSFLFQGHHACVPPCPPPPSGRPYLLQRPEDNGEGEGYARAQQDGLGDDREEEFGLGGPAGESQGLNISGSELRKQEKSVSTELGETEAENRDISMPFKQRSRQGWRVPAWSKTIDIADFKNIHRKMILPIALYQQMLKFRGHNPIAREVEITKTDSRIRQYILWPPT